MTVIIVDDEPQSHEVLKNLLEKSHSEVRIVANGYNVAEGLALIRTHKPDLVFLDVEMPDGTGFDLLEQIGHPDFCVVFITAHNKYAITAFHSGALDFLLKPVTSDALSYAMGQIHQKQKEKLSDEQWKVAFEAFKRAQQQKLPTRMTVSTLDGIEYIPIDEIIRFEAKGNQTEIYIHNINKRLIASVNIGTYEEQFELYPTFMKVHRSHIVNLLFVQKFVRSDGGGLVMKDNKEVPVSKLYREALLAALERI